MSKTMDFPRASEWGEWTQVERIDTALSLLVEAKGRADRVAGIRPTMNEREATELLLDAYSLAGRQLVGNGLVDDDPDFPDPGVVGWKTQREAAIFYTLRQIRDELRNR